MEEKISKLMQDEDVTNKKGIYEYLLTNSERALSIRAFNDKQKREKFEEQKGIKNDIRRFRTYFKRKSI
jgi:hypothetical protein